MKLKNKYRTHTCGELRAADNGKVVTLCGFFVRTKLPDAFEVRDRHGAVRVVLGPRVGEALRERVKESQPEDVVQVTGDVLLRAEPDPSAPTGDVYIFPKGFTTIARADPLPPDVGPLVDPDAADPEQRLRFRYLDLRRPAMQKRLAFRSKFLLEVRAHLVAQDFVEVETPLLGRYSAEEPVAFLVPSTPSRAFALPQSPQLYKQLLMVAGCDRYFQIARCFRNEHHLTPDRQPEFTALDLEMAFIDEEDIYPVVDDLLAQVFRATLGRKVELPVRRLTYADALRRYGTDRPDLRFDLELDDATEEARRWPIPEVKDALSNPEGGLRYLRVPHDLCKFDVGFLEGLPIELRGRWNAWFSWFRVDAPTRFSGPFPKERELQVMRDACAATGAKPGDVILLAAAPHKAIASAAMAEVRVRVGRALRLIDRDRHAFCWVREFPFFEYDPAAQGWNGARHPFTQPFDEDVGRMGVDRHSVRAKAYDLVLNGVEVGAGSIRNHDPETQDQVFRMFEYPAAEISKRFGFVLEAFKFGVPPHGGISISLDRILAQLFGTSAIGEVIAFPKNEQGRDLMMEAPSRIDAAFLKQLLT